MAAFGENIPIRWMTDTFDPEKELPYALHALWAFTDAQRRELQAFGLRLTGTTSWSTERWWMDETIVRFRYESDMLLFRMEFVYDI